MKNILIIVDMQEGFSRFEQTKKLSKDIINLLEKDLFDAVIATRFLNEDNSMYEKMFGWKRLKTDEDRSIPAEMAKHVDCFVDKYIYNCVNPSFIQRLCQLNNGEFPEKVFIVGADTDCCVLTTATSLFENNIRPIVLTNFVNSNGGEESHNAGMCALRRLIGSGQLSDINPNTREELEGI